MWQSRATEQNRYERCYIRYGLAKGCDYKNDLEQTNYTNDCCSVKSNCATMKAHCKSDCCSRRRSSCYVMKNQNRTNLHVSRSNTTSLHAKMSRC